jgi:hypothetical protein
MRILLSDVQPPLRWVAACATLCDSIGEFGSRQDILPIAMLEATADSGTPTP